MQVRESMVNLRESVMIYCQRTDPAGMLGFDGPRMEKSDESNAVHGEADRREAS